MPPKRTAPRNSGGQKNRRKRARAKNSGSSSNPQNEAPLHSLLGGSDNQPLSKLNRPRPKGSTKKKRGKHIFLESDDPLEKVSSKLNHKTPTKANSLTRLIQNIVDKSPMPDGYTFVPKGDVYITRNCRIKTKESDQMVYTVWVSPFSTPTGTNHPC